LKIKKEYDQLEKLYPTIRNEERLPQLYTDQLSSLNTHFIKSDIQDVFELLVCTIHHNKTNNSSISIDK